MLLYKIGIKDESLNRIQQGFHKAFQEIRVTASSYFSGKDYDPAGKTGTAQHEVYEDGKKLAETENLTLVGYAPFDEPEVAFAVVVPNTGNVSGQHAINNLIGEKIVDDYIDLKEERDKKSKKENN